MVDLLSDERTIIQGILFSCQASCRRQNISSFLRWSTIHRSTFLLYFCLRVARRQCSPSRSFAYIFRMVLRTGFFRFFFCSSPLFWIILGQGEMYRTTDNYIFRHARLLCRIMGCGNRGPFPQGIGEIEMMGSLREDLDVGRVIIGRYLFRGNHCPKELTLKINESFSFFRLLSTYLGTLY